MGIKAIIISAMVIVFSASFCSAQESKLEEQKGWYSHSMCKGVNSSKCDGNVLKSVFITTKKGQDIVAFTPANYKEKDSFEKVRLVYAGMTLAGRASNVTTINGIKLTKENIKKYPEFQEDYEYRSAKNIACYIMLSLIIGSNPEIVFSDKILL